MKIEGEASEIIELFNYFISKHQVLSSNQILSSNCQPEPQLEKAGGPNTEPKTKPRPAAKCEESAYMDSVKDNVVISFVQENVFKNMLVNKMRVRTKKSKYFFDFEYDAIERSYNYRHEECAITIADKTKGELKSGRNYWVFSNHNSCEYQSSETKSMILECVDMAHRIARFSQEGIVPFDLDAVIENAKNNVLIEIAYSRGERFVWAEIKGNLMKFKPENWPFKNKPVSLDVKGMEK